MTRVMITGAGGFAGHHCLEHVLASTDWMVIAVDSIRPKGKASRISQVLEGHPDWGKRVSVVMHDLAAAESSHAFLHLAGKVDYIISYASDASVSRSIAHPVPFMLGNTGIALSVLEMARVLESRALIWVSTAEVFGPMDSAQPFREWDRLLPQSPYAASKAAQDALCTAWWRTYGVPVVIAGTQNLFGERQDPGKLVPTAIRCALTGTPLTRGTWRTASCTCCKTAWTGDSRLKTTRGGQAGTTSRPRTRWTTS